MRMPLAGGVNRHRNRTRLSCVLAQGSAYWSGAAATHDGRYLSHVEPRVAPTGVPNKARAAYRTTVGTTRPMRVPSPSWPDLLSPQQ